MEVTKKQHIACDRAEEADKEQKDKMLIDILIDGKKKGFDIIEIDGYIRFFISDYMGIALKDPKNYRYVSVSDNCICVRTNMGKGEKSIKIKLYKEEKDY